MDQRTRERHPHLQRRRVPGGRDLGPGPDAHPRRLRGPAPHGRQGQGPLRRPRGRARDRRGPHAVDGARSPSPRRPSTPASSSATSTSSRRTSSRSRSIRRSPSPRPRSSTSRTSEWDLHGDLTIHGVTRPVTLKTEYNGQTGRPVGRHPRLLLRRDEDRPRGLGPHLERGARDRRLARGQGDQDRHRGRVGPPGRTDAGQRAHRAESGGGDPASGHLRRGCGYWRATHSSRGDRSMNSFGLYILCFAVPLIIGLAVQGWLRSTFARNSRVPVGSGLTGADVARADPRQQRAPERAGPAVEGRPAQRPLRPAVAAACSSPRPCSPDAPSRRRPSPRTRSGTPSSTPGPTRR